jgi:hypothetical protein
MDTIKCKRNEISHKKEHKWRHISAVTVYCISEGISVIALTGAKLTFEIQACSLGSHVTWKIVTDVSEKLC